MILNKELSIEENSKLLVYDDFYQGESFPKKFMMENQNDLAPVSDSKAPGIQIMPVIKSYPALSDHVYQRLLWVMSVLGRKVYLCNYYLRCQLEEHQASSYAHIDPCEYSLFIYLNDIQDNGKLGFSMVEHETGINLADFGKAQAFSTLSSFSNDKSKWKTIHYVPYKLNRAILVRSNIFHTGSDYGAGTTIETARLSEHYFMNTKEFITDHFRHHLEQSK